MFRSGIVAWTDEFYRTATSYSSDGGGFFPAIVRVVFLYGGIDTAESDNEDAIRRVIR